MERLKVPIVLLIIALLFATVGQWFVIRGQEQIMDEIRAARPAPLIHVDNCD